MERLSRRIAARLLPVVLVTVLLPAVSPACGGENGRQDPPSVTGQIGPEGGTVELQDFALEIGADAVPETVEVTLRQRDRLDSELAAEFDGDDYRAVGPAVELEADFRVRQPMIVTWEFAPEALPEGFEPENVAVFAAGPVYREVDPDASPAGGEPVATAGVWPVAAVVDSEASTVSFPVHGPATFQVAAARRPLDIRRAPSSEEAAESEARATRASRLHAEQAGQPETRRQGQFQFNGPAVIFEPTATGGLSEQQKLQLEQKLRNALAAAHAGYTDRGFRPPWLRSMVLVVRNLSNSGGGQVSSINPWVIAIDPKTSKPTVESNLAHELFHSVQFFNTNQTSVDRFFVVDTWLLEGSADWAEDEIYDATHSYYAPGARRFLEPLNKNAKNKQQLSLDLYQTVIFWKWLETKASGTLREAVDRQRARTLGGEQSAGYDRMTGNLASFTDSLREVRGNIDFQGFFESVYFYKDFEADETGTGELWDVLLGPRTFPLGVLDSQALLQKGGVGDGEAKAFSGSHAVARHLASRTTLLVNGSGAQELRGTLHVQFDAAPGLVATLIDEDSGQKARTTTLSGSQELTMPFGANSRVLILHADPRFLQQGAGATNAPFKAWVEPRKSPCGPLPGTVHRVSKTFEILAAIEEAEAGDTVLIAPGRYTLPSTKLPSFDYGGTWGAMAITKELTIAGSGPDETELRTKTTDGFFWVLNNPHTTFRDLELRSITSFGTFAVRGVEELTFCNVEAHFPETWTDAAVSLVANVPELPTLDRVEVTDSVFEGPTDPGGGSPGIGFNIGYASEGQKASVTLVVRNSRITHWNYGIFYVNNELAPNSPDVTLDIDDCSATFSNNRLFNICERSQSGPCVEKCPVE